MARSTRLMFGGFAGMLTGWLFLMAITIRLIPPAFVPAFAAYAVSFFGLAAGLVGVYIRWEQGSQTGSTAGPGRSQ